MTWQRIKVLALTVSLTAFAFEGFHHRMLVRQSWCDTFGGTWLGYFCEDKSPAGGGGSGAN